MPIAYHEKTFWRSRGGTEDLVEDMATLPSTSAERKSELLIIARRSRIKWVRSALDADILKNGDVIEKLTAVGNAKQSKEVSTSSKTADSDSFQRAFDFLTDVIADGETFDVDSLIRRANAIEDNDSFNENLDDPEVYSPLSPISLSETSVEIYTYAIFLDTLCSRGSIRISKSMQQFVSKFESRARQRAMSPDEKLNQEEAVRSAESVWGFLDHIGNEIQESSDSLWRGECERRSLTKSYCERFIFSKIYSITFHRSYEDYFLNEKLWERILSLSFLRPEHLDIKIFGRESTHGLDTNLQSTLVADKDKDTKWWLEYINDAVLSLQRLQHATCPEDKMRCIKVTSEAIQRALLRNSIEDNSSDAIGSPSPLGADDVLPLLILCVKESNPLCLHSEIKYLQTYLNPGQLYGEAGYLITQLASAVNFLESVDATALTISREEFSRSLRRCREKRNRAAAVPEDSEAASMITAAAAGTGARTSPRGTFNPSSSSTSTSTRGLQHTNQRKVGPANGNGLKSCAGAASNVNVNVHEARDREVPPSLSLSLLEMYKLRSRSSQ